MGPGNQYLFALMPPGDLSAEIDAIRKEFADTYGSRHALKTPPHLTLQPPFQSPEKEVANLIRLVQPLAFYQAPLRIRLENFSGFTESGTIYINVCENPELTTFQRNLTSRLRKSESGTDFPRKFHPHFTIATRDIPAPEFESALAAYRDKHFRGQFTATSFFLWKHNGKKWQVLEEFAFEGGKVVDKYTQHMMSPLGPITIVSNGRALTEVKFEEATESHPDTITAKAVEQLEEYFEGTRQLFELPLEPAGTDFQRKVWEALCKIPYGNQVSYLKLSIDTGDKNAIRAVGLANGKNPIPVIIPCHRVIGSSGQLTGYSGGLRRKQWLLEHEARTAGKGQQFLFSL